MSSDDRKEQLAAEKDDLNKQILGSIAKPYKGEQTSRWIRDLDDEALVNEIVQGDTDRTLNMPSPNLLDRLFDEFQRYAYEYQQKSAQSGQRFPINIGRPQGSDAPSSNQYGTVPVLCKGYVSTSRWAMIFFGLVGKVQAFIVPVEYTVGFQPSQKDYKPYVEMKAVTEHNQTDWRIENQSLPAAALPALAKRFFGALIKVEREEAKHTDQFVMDPSIPVAAPARPQRLEESDAVELLSDAVLQQEAAKKRAFQQAGGGGASGQYPQMGAPATQSGQYQSLQSQSSSQPQRYQQPAQPAGNMPPGDGANDSIPEAFSRNSANFHGAVAEFCARIDAEIDRLTKIGMMSISAQDMVGAQQTIIRSAKLKEMRDRVNDLSNEWNSVVSQ